MSGDVPHRRGSRSHRLAADPRSIEPVIDAAERSAGTTRDLLGESLGWLAVMRDALAAARESGGDQAAMQGHLSAADGALERMNALVHAAMQSRSLPIGSPLLAGCAPVTLGDAVRHAIEALGPRAEELRVVVAGHVSPDAEATASGPLYAAVLAVLRASLESIARAGGVGRVDVLAWVQRLSSREPGLRRVVVEVRDDGVGEDERGVVAEELRLAASLVRGGAGTMSLVARPERSACERRGATVRMEWPVAGDTAVRGNGREDAA